MIVDIGIIGIILVVALIAGRVGFIRTVYQLVSSILALILAFIVYPVIQMILKLTPLYTGVQQWIGDRMPSIDARMGLQEQGAFIREVTSWLPDFVGEYLVQNNNSEVYALLGVQDLINYITVYIADICIMILAIIIAWITVKIGLSIFISVLDVVSKLPILRTANMLAGFGVGVIKGVFVIWMILIVFPILILIPEFAQLELWMQDAILGQYLYNNNFILEVINTIIFK